MCKHSVRFFFFEVFSLAAYIVFILNLKQLHAMECNYEVIMLAGKTGKWFLLLKQRFNRKIILLTPQ